MIDQQVTDSFFDEIQKIVPEGKIMAGKHYSPEVIMRESADVATLPPRTREAFQFLRDPAEMEMMGRRFEYGTAPSRATKREIMREFEKGNV